MKQMMCMALLFAAAVCAFALEIPKPVGFANDFAGTLQQEERSALETKLRTYRDASGIDFTVVTVASLQGMPIEDFALQLGRAWGVGGRDTSNGIILLIAPNEHKYRIEISRHLEGDLTDGESGSLLRQHLVPHLKKNEWAAGINESVDAIIAALGSEPMQQREEARARKLAEKEQSDRAFWRTVGYGGLVFAVIGGIFILLALRRARKAREQREQEEEEERQKRSKKTETVEDYDASSHFHRGNDESRRRSGGNKRSRSWKRDTESRSSRNDYVPPSSSRRSSESSSSYTPSTDYSSSGSSSYSSSSDSSSSSSSSSDSGSSFGGSTDFGGGGSSGDW